MKKFIALVLAVVLVLALCTVAFAAYKEIKSSDCLKASLATDILKKIIPSYTTWLKNPLTKITLSGWNDSVLSFANSVGAKVYDFVETNPKLASSTSLIMKVMANPQTIAATLAKGVYYLGSIYY